MNNKDVIQKFYQSFSDGNPEGMIDCYHNDITFEDPAFGVLKGEKAKSMWKMLLSRKDAKPSINFSNVEANEEMGKAHWVAEYNYGPKKRKVINKIDANFDFLDGKIINHKDDFNLWKWTQQALGISGYLLGWSPFMKKQIQQKTNKLLTDYMKKNG